MKFDFDSFKKSIPQKSAAAKAVGSMTAAQGESIIRLTKQKLKINDSDPEELETTMALISDLLQNGGSNRNAGANVLYTLSGHLLSAADFQKFCREATSGGTARQFARAMAKDIHQFAVILDEEGDLARQMRLDDSLLPRDQAYWCSNFQSNKKS